MPQIDETDKGLLAHEQGFPVPFQRIRSQHNEKLFHCGKARSDAGNTNGSYHSERETEERKAK